MILVLLWSLIFETALSLATYLYVFVYLRAESLRLANLKAGAPITCKKCELASVRKLNPAKKAKLGETLMLDQKAKPVKVIGNWWAITSVYGRQGEFRFSQSKSVWEKNQRPRSQKWYAMLRVPHQCSTSDWIGGQKSCLRCALIGCPFRFGEQRRTLGESFLRKPQIVTQAVDKKGAVRPHVYMCCCAFLLRSW